MTAQIITNSHIEVLSHLLLLLKGKKVLLTLCFHCQDEHQVKVCVIIAYTFLKQKLVNEYL